MPEKLSTIFRALSTDVVPRMSRMILAKAIFDADLEEYLRVLRKYGGLRADLPTYRTVALSE